MAILLFAEHDNETLSDQTAKALTAALAIGSDVHVLVAGKGAKGAADQAAKLAGVKKVLLADSPDLENRLAEASAALIVSLAGNYDTIIAAATTNGKNILPRAAALLDVMQVSDIIEVISPDTFKRPIYAGNALQTVQATDAKKVITVRTATFAAAAEGGSASVRLSPPRPTRACRSSSKPSFPAAIVRNSLPRRSSSPAGVPSARAKNSRK